MYCIIPPSQRPRFRNTQDMSPEHSSPSRALWSNLDCHTTCQQDVRRTTNTFQHSSKNKSPAVSSRPAGLPKRTHDVNYCVWCSRAGTAPLFAFEELCRMLALRPPSLPSRTHTGYFCVWYSGDREIMFAHACTEHQPRALIALFWFQEPLSARA